MSTVIKELIAKFTADYSGLETGTSKANSAIGSFAKAATAAAVVAAGAFAALAIHEARIGDELGKASDRAGEATEKFIELGHATEMAGLSTDELSNVLKFMQKNIYDAAAGNKELEASLRRLGTTSKELLALSPAEAFKKMTIALGGLGSAAERTKISMELFGRSGTSVLTLAREGKEYFAAMAAEADRFGLTITRLDSKELNDANDAVAKIGMAAAGAARQFDVGLAPAVTTVTERIVRLVDWSDMFRKMGMGMGLAVTQAFDTITLAIDTAHLGILGLEAGYYKLKEAKDKFFGNETQMHDSQNELIRLEGDKQKLVKEMYDIQNYKKGATKDFLDEEYKNFLEKRKKISVGGGMGGGIPVPLSQAALDEAAKAARKYAEQIKSAMEDTVKYNNTIADQFISLKDGFLQGGKAIDSFKKAALNAINEIGNNMIKQAFGGASSGGIFGSIASGIMGGFGGPLGGGSSFTKNLGRIDWLPSFAVGTNYVPRDMVAKIHEGEQIIPKGKSASGGTVIQNVTINAGVSQTVRAEITRLLPQIKMEAARAVAENSFRGITP